MPLPPLFLEIWQQLTQEKAQEVEREEVLAILEERHAALAKTEVAEGDQVVYVVDGQTPLRTLRQWAGKAKAGPADGDKTAERIANARVFGIPGRTDFRYHFSKTQGTPFVALLKRETTKVFVVEVVKADRKAADKEALELEVDWTFGLYAIQVADGWVRGLKRKFENVQVRGAFISRRTMGGEEKTTAHTLIYNFGPSWRNKLTDEDDVWLGVLPLLLAHVKEECFRCKGP